MFRELGKRDTGQGRTPDQQDTGRTIDRPTSLRRKSSDRLQPAPVESPEQVPDSNTFMIKGLTFPKGKIPDFPLRHANTGFDDDMEKANPYVEGAKRTLIPDNYNLNKQAYEKIGWSDSYENRHTGNERLKRIDGYYNGIIPQIDSFFLRCELNDNGRYKEIYEFLKQEKQTKVDNYKISFTLFNKVQKYEKEANYKKVTEELMGFYAELQNQYKQQRQAEDPDVIGPSANTGGPDVIGVSTDQNAALQRHYNQQRQAIGDTSPDVIGPSANTGGPDVINFSDDQQWYKELSKAIDDILNAAKDVERHNIFGYGQKSRDDINSERKKIFERAILELGYNKKKAQKIETSNFRERAEALELSNIPAIAFTGLNQRQTTIHNLKNILSDLNQLRSNLGANLTDRDV